ncbi:MAG: hypothetical protein ABFD79_10140 [Phycisphaerales bacterium]
MEIKPKNIPDISLQHLQRLTDDTGLIQHAKYIIADRKHGYCTDDNARALLVVTKYYNNNPSAEALKLFEIYLSFLYHAIKPEKTVYNFLDYDRKWRTCEPAADALGRVIWAFGSAIRDCPNQDYVPMITEFFNDAANHIPNLSTRAKAYSILGLADYLHKFPSDKYAKDLLKQTADTLCNHFIDTSAPDWHWYENTISYANAILPAATFEAAKILDDKSYLDVAKKSCDFMLKHTYNGNYFSFIGSNGWHVRGKERAQFDQQPIEAAYTVIMLAKAFETTENTDYLDLQRKAFEWFLGANDLNLPLYDEKTKGCCDGICKHGVNINQGAESTLSYLLARLFLHNP